MHTDPAVFLRALRAAGLSGLTVVPGPDAGDRRMAAEPALSLMVPVSDPEAVRALPDRIQSWFDDGIRLVTGALAFEAAAGLHSPDCARTGEGPLAVLHGYRGYYHWQAASGHCAAIGDVPEPAADGPPGAWSLDGAFSATLGAEDYRDQIRRIRDYLHAGDCYQVNLAQRLDTRYTGDPLAGWLRLTQAHPAPFAGYLEWDGGALLSASPERFLSIREGQVITEPIKGTRPRGRTEEEDQQLAGDLLRSAKDHAENLMIVDLLRNDLGRICRPGSIAVPELAALYRYSNVQHLVSRVTGELRAGVRPLDALLACFPGGSITGAPKRRAMEIIAELEPVPRGFYCGSMFWQTDDGDFDSNILIRTLQAGADGSLSCHGGGGIVVDSDPRAEYEETLFKVRALMEAVGKQSRKSKAESRKEE